MIIRQKEKLLVRNKYYAILLIMTLSMVVPGNEDACGQTIVVQTFDDLPFQSLDDLEHLGVAFDFKLNGVDSTEAHFASFGPVATEHVTDPSIIGDSGGILTIQFEIPTPVVSFGLALSDSGPVSEAVKLAFYNAMGELIASESASATASPLATGFSDLRYEYRGMPVQRIVLDFADDPGSFALDNLTYAVPEPNMAWVVSICVMVAVGKRGRLRAAGNARGAASGGRQAAVSFAIHLPSPA